MSPQVKIRALRRVIPLLIAAALLLNACTFGFDPGATVAPDLQPQPGGGGPSGGETAVVVSVIDGDTIDVRLNNQVVRVRYVGMNTPERDEICYSEAVQANRLLVEGKTVRMVRDSSDTDRFGRLLRYIYVNNLFVNAALVEQGFAEVVSYPPDTANFNYFRDLENQARAANRGCHPTGIFNDGSDTR